MHRIEGLIILIAALQDEFDKQMQKAVGDELSGLYQRADRVSLLAFKCLIYHGVAPSAHGLPFYEECIPLAREAVTEYLRCFALLSSHGKSAVEIYIHW